MEWIYLLLAGFFEVGWATTMKYSEGLSKIVPSVITIILYLASMVFLSFAMKKLPLGSTYAMWTGFGIIGTSLLGIVLFGESLGPLHILCIAMIAGGIIGLKLIA